MARTLEEIEWQALSETQLEREMRLERERMRFMLQTMKAIDTIFLGSFQSERDDASDDRADHSRKLRREE